MIRRNSRLATHDSRLGTLKNNRPKRPNRPRIAAAPCYSLLNKEEPPWQPCPNLTRAAQPVPFWPMSPHSRALTRKPASGAGRASPCVWVVCPSPSAPASQKRACWGPRCARDDNLAIGLRQGKKSHPSDESPRRQKHTLFCATNTTGKAGTAGYRGRPRHHGRRYNCLSKPCTGLKRNTVQLRTASQKASLSSRVRSRAGFAMGGEKLVVTARFRPSPSGPTPRAAWRPIPPD